MAGRYVAWEEASGPASANSSRSTAVVGSRFFSAPESAIASGQSSDGATANGVNPLWGSESTRATTEGTGSFWDSLKFQDTVTANAASLQSSVDRSSLGGVAGAVSDSVETIGSALNFASGVNWQLPGGDYSKGTVTVEAKVGNLLTPIGSSCSAGNQAQTGDGLAATTNSSVCFTESNAILTDTWSVPATENVERTIEEHTKALVPASVLQPVGRFVSNIGRLPVVEELRGLENAFGYVDAAPLPDGRSLGNYPEGEL